MKQKFTKSSRFIIACMVMFGVALSQSLLFAANLTYPSVNKFSKKLPQEVKGKVVDDTGKGLPGATVTIKGTKKAVITDNQGNFAVNVNPGDVLVITYTGYSLREITINNQMELNITLKEINNDLQEVIIQVPYGAQKKATVTGAISSVSFKELKQSPVSNLNNALVGRLPGLIGIQPSGDPGRDAAALLIRGRGTYNNATPLVLVDGIERNFTTIDVNEVENISILKDASATAVFGVRGANGVILVTTKRGAEGKPVVSVTANAAMQQPTRLPNFLGSYDFAVLYNEAYKNDGKPPLYSDVEIEGYKNKSDPYLYPDVDYFEEFLKPNAFQYSLNANVSGGTKVAKYFVSGSYFSQNGLLKHLKNDDFNANINYGRYNFRSNVDLDVTKNLRISANLAARAETRRGPVNTTQSSISMLMSYPPLSSPLLNPDGTFGYNWRQENVLAAYSTHGLTKDYNNKLEGTAIINYKLESLLKGLSVRASVSFTNEYIQSQSRFRGSAGSTNDWYFRYKILGKNPDGSYIYSEPAGTYAPNFNFSQSFDGASSRTTYLEAAINYANNIGKHNFSGLILANRNRRIRNTSTLDWPFSYQGLVGRFTYNYDEKYLVEANFGYNGSENFPPGKRYGFFPAFSVGWVASNENFVKNAEWINLLKFRASHGQVGNDRFGGDENNPSTRFLFFQNSFPTGTGYSFGLTNNSTVAGFLEGSFGNPIITWEKANKSNLGLETSFFKGLIALNVDVFYEKRNNILTQPGTIPATVGQTLQVVNLGIVENKGFEIELSHTKQIKEFRYTIKGTIAQARNKILFRDEAEARYPWMRETGTPIGQVRGYQSAGFFNNQAEIDAWAKTSLDPGPFGKLQPGDIKYVDQNEDGLIDVYDQVAIGNPTPDFTFAGYLSANYKNFDMSILFQGTENVTMLRSAESAWDFFNKGKVMDFHMNRWTPATASTATYPRLSSAPSSTQHNYVVSDFWTIDASYMRLKSVEIGYTFPKLLINNIGLQNARVFVNGANLYTWDKIKYLDPENRNDRAWYYPQQRVFNFGVNVTF